MAENGYGPLAGHIGRIPNYGKNQPNPMGSVEPPPCIQNAMMTKDKKPFTYTPGGLDLSQIRTPSMARRLARQRSQEEHEQAYAQQPHPATAYHPQGGPAPPPPPPPKIPAPPPPPPLVIEAPTSKSPKPVTVGERPEIVIPENPIGMLRKTNSPYHWEAEKAELNRIGPVPKFQDKKPSPLTVTMPPSSFSQQPPQMYAPQGQTSQGSNYPYGNRNQPESPIHRPEAQYAHQKSNSPNVNGSPLTRELLQRQDSQFNKSPQPFGAPSPVSNGSPYSPTPNNNWRQPERRDSPANNVHSPQFAQSNRNQFSPNVQQCSPEYTNQTSPRPVFHTLPRNAPRVQDNYVNNTQNSNAIYNNIKEPATQSPREDDPTPWRTSTLNRQPREPEDRQSIYHNSKINNQQPTYTPPWQSNESKNNQADNAYIPSWKQENKFVGQNQQQQQCQPPQQQYNPWVQQQDNNNNNRQDNYNQQWRSQNNPVPTSPPNKQCQPQDQPRYQSSMSIPVTPRKQNSQPEFNNNQTAPQKEAVYVNEEPVYYCPESPKSVPPWVKTQKEKTKTPPPVWCQRPLEGRRSAPRELVTPPRDTEPEWVKKSNEMQRGVREVISPPKYQQQAQPTWSTRPSENRKSLPRETTPGANGQPGTRVIPIQMEVSNTDSRDHGRQGNQQPPLRIVINMNTNPQASPQGQNQAPYSQPTQRIMRVLSPQLVRMDDSPSQNDLPTLNRSYQNQSNQDTGPKTRIIPIQIEGGGNGGANKSFGGRY
ncbi:extensin-like isoform X2 [Hyposmocoma kahamanoa]|uniref:extensin-like isoform X2 n=1 Tax=Hyposmocoma kahamanoa TaxID=1477025 RepID=UPI000E6D6B83|nr:extensin-like isoform X2 [Hyposmocoma kahamanoa]